MSVNTSNGSSSTQPQWGRVLITGGTDWAKLGRKDRVKAAEGVEPECVPCQCSPRASPLIPSRNPDLLEPHILRSLSNVRAVSVHTSCCSCHNVVIDADGSAWLFGRNAHGQLGVPGTAISENAPRRVTPRELGASSSARFVHAACGRYHTLLVADEGQVWAAGANTLGQCGQDVCPEINKFKRVSVLDREDNEEHVVKAAAGISFSVVLTKSGKLYAFGSAEKGQLGNGDTGERLATGQRVVFGIETVPLLIKELANRTIVDVSAGQQHCIAIDDAGVVFVWGYNGYCRLGLGDQKDRLKPVVVPHFAGPKEISMGSLVTAGPTNSVVVDKQGVYYMAGKWKNSGEGSVGSPWTYFKPIQDIMACRTTHVSCGGVTHFVLTPNDEAGREGKNMTVCWGQNAANGELGLGPDENKSATKATKNKPLLEVDVIDVAAGQHTTLFIARPSDELSDRPRHPFDVDAPEACLGCGKASEDDELLECEKCDAPYHLTCLNPPLSAVPEGEWFCPKCIATPGAPVGRWAQLAEAQAGAKRKAPVDDAAYKKARQ
ncbi:RCC1/BLIP-II [Schizophyllum commune Tattone D]|nr:RCC1/BLIP-II [Schizophyllum commune Tattone D]